MERGTRVAGKYELRERLGRGGMGEVWSGRDRDLHRDVAVKLLVRDADASPDLLHRFEREAIAAAQINHPNVVGLYDRGVHDGLQFLVMEHVDGTTLAHHLHQHAPLPVEGALRITQEICAALVAAHRAQVVHYDIKPSNVMLTTDGRVKVVDFGIAGFSHTHTFTVAPTSALSPVGTALYGAPEQFLDERGDHRSDLYALGGVLFALLTGQPPFGEGSPLSVIRRKLDEPPRSLRDFRPDVPEPVARLVTDLLQREPDQRPQTAVAVHERLEHLRASPSPSDQVTPEARTQRLPPPAPTRTITERTPTQAPNRKQAAVGGAAAHAKDAFTVTWTGREPVSRYVTYRRRAPLVWHWLAFSLVALMAINFTVVLIRLWPDDGQFSDDLKLLGALAALIDTPAALYGWWLTRRAMAWKRHHEAVPHRRPWSLRIDATGITTTDPRRSSPLGGPAGRRKYAWDQLDICTLGHGEEFPDGPRYSVLQVWADEDEEPFAAAPPAGLVNARPVQPQNGLWPLCVLGPLTDSQHRALVTALERHSGGRWDPDISE